MRLPASFELSASKSYRLLRRLSCCTTSLKMDEDLVDCWHATMLLILKDVVFPLSKTARALLAEGMIWVVMSYQKEIRQEKYETNVDIGTVDGQASLLPSYQHRHLAVYGVFLRGKLGSVLLSVHVGKPCMLL